MTTVARRSAAMLCAAVTAVTLVADAVGASRDRDPHYTEAGFFDIHVCHWPQRPMFYMVLFATTRFAEIRDVEVFFPDGRLLVRLDLDRYRLVRVPGKPDKRTFITQVDLPKDAPDGWYGARVCLHDGREYQTRDYVRIARLPQASGLTPASGDAPIARPKELRWDPVPGATHYQVFIKNLWDGDAGTFSSKLLTSPSLTLPADLLKPDGLYSWHVHARDVNEHPELGDFNHGSLSPEVLFTTAP
jgi:hypothetical protein